MLTVALGDQYAVLELSADKGCKSSGLWLKFNRRPLMRGLHMNLLELADMKARKGVLLRLQ